MLNFNLSIYIKLNLDENYFYDICFLNSFSKYDTSASKSRDDRNEIENLRALISQMAKNLKF